MVDYCDLWRFISQSQLCNGDQDGWKWHWPWKLGKFISDFLNIFGRIGQFIETYGGFLSQNQHCNEDQDRWKCI